MLISGQEYPLATYLATVQATILAAELALEARNKRPDFADHKDPYWGSEVKDDYLS